jgi:hypothetical protein
MRTRMFSPLLLVVGVTLGLMAMWTVASPVGTTGDLITGGWITCTWDAKRYACGSTSCDSEYCQSSALQSCELYAYGDCSGGYITVASCGSGGSTFYAYGGTLSPCYGLGCGNIVRHATCY